MIEIRNFCQDGKDWEKSDIPREIYDMVKKL